MSDKPKTCTIDDDKLQPCFGLDKAMAGTVADKRKGVVLFESFNRDTKNFRSTAVLRSGSLHKNGCIMNYCPFCGASIGHHFKAKEVGTSDPTLAGEAVGRSGEPPQPKTCTGTPTRTHRKRMATC